MAGVKGRSGGARPGAGRKRKAPAAAPDSVSVTLEAQPHGGALKRSKAEEPEPSDDLVDGKTREPLEFLELVLNNPLAPLKDRIRAAIAAAQYKHTKLHDGGKKDAVAGKAKQAAAGRFGARPAPLRVIGGGG